MAGRLGYWIGRGSLLIAYTLFVSLISLYCICAISGLVQATIIALSGNIIPLIWYICLGLSALTVGKWYYDYG